MNKLTKNCECCNALYEVYKVGAPSETTSFWRQDIGEKGEKAGLCAFCNPKSKLYNHSPDHATESCKR